MEPPSLNHPAVEPLAEPPCTGEEPLAVGTEVERLHREAQWRLSTQELLTRSSSVERRLLENPTPNAANVFGTSLS